MNANLTKKGSREKTWRGRKIVYELSLGRIINLQIIPSNGLTEKDYCDAYNFLREKQNDWLAENRTKVFWYF